MVITMVQTITQWSFHCVTAKTNAFVIGKTFFQLSVIMAQLFIELSLKCCLGIALGREASM